MKIKDLERTANVAWSPKSQVPILLAAGTAAQQLDASFNTNATLEIHALNLSEAGPDLLTKVSTPSEQRFHKIVWGEQNGGTIIGGCDGGTIHIYSASKLLKGDNGLVSRQERHAGHVSTLDFNPFQANLFASGAADSEIFIWDLNNVTSPMSPGAKSQPHEDVLSVGWNRQVQHILASTFASKCVIWDLRKEHPIIKLTDTVSRIRWKVVAWHPEVATQLCLASEEDHSPIIQLWDLRFATSPLKTLENHQRGILSIAWCREDPDLLVSCGKDNRIICWNPNSNQTNGEVLSEIAKTNQWNFDVQWCARNPAIIACPSFDGHVSIYSLMGGKTQQIQTTNKIADSFPGMDGYVDAPLPQTNATVPVSVDLTKPPKWLKRPVGARFGFGGQLIWFENNQQKIVNIGQLVTEPDLVQKSIELEQALEYGNFSEYCKNKADETDDQHKKYIWYFLKANFDENPRVELLNLLGYQIDDVNNKLNNFIGKKLINNVDNLTEQFNNLNRIDSIDAFESIIQAEKNVEKFKIKTGDDTEGLITQALLLGNVEAAVELCLKSKRFADAIIISMTGGSDLLARTQHAYLEQCEGYVSSLISALVSEDWAAVINNCELNSWKEALAATLTHCNDETLPLLCEQLGDRLLGDLKFKQDSQLCYICAGSFDKLVNTWSGNALNSTTDLQELVELVNFLQKSVERQGRQVKISGALAQLYSHYASLLASQGKLSTALNYLGDSSQDERVISLRERLSVNLGQTTNYPVQIGRQQPQSRRNSNRQSSSNYLPQNQVYGGQQQQQQQQQQLFNTGLPNAATTQPWQQQQLPPPQTFSPVPQAPPPSQPPRPTSVGSNQGGGGLPQRKYVLDPSVTSNPYGGTSFKNSYQPSSINQYGMPFSSSMGGNVQQFNQSALPPNLSTNQFPQSSAAPFSPSNSSSFPPTVDTSAAPTFFTPQPPVQYNSPPTLVSNYGVPNVSSGGGGGPQIGMSPFEIGQVMTERASSAPGWNDPPLLHKPPKSQLGDNVIMSPMHAGIKLWRRNQPKQDNTMQPVQPITHPLYGTNNTQESNGCGDQMWKNDVIGGPQLFQPPSGNNFAPAPPPTSYSPGGFKQNAITSNYGHQQPPANYTPCPSSVMEKPQIIQKPLIPEEHVHMQTVFDDLKNRCSCAANNPQTKRKLDDVSRKLEALYDLLREHKLSPTTLASLHQMVQLVQNGDYTGGLGLHTQLVSGPDFAQIASFMPGLKVLLQCALQLQVYLR